MTPYACILLSLVLGQTEPSKSPTAKELVEKVIESRAAIKSGKGELIETQRKKQFKFAFEGKKLRFDTPQCRNINDGKRLFYFLDDPPPPGILTIREAANPAGLFPVADVRGLGIMPTLLGHLYSFKPEEIVKWDELVTSTVQREKLDDRDCWFVEILHKSGKLTRLWIDPERGDNVVLRRDRLGV